jgi:hypothetical protein
MTVFAYPAKTPALEDLPRRKIRLAAWNSEAWNGRFSSSNPLFFLAAIFGGWGSWTRAGISPARDIKVLELKWNFSKRLDLNHRSFFTSNCPDRQWNTSGIREWKGGIGSTLDTPFSFAAKHDGSKINLVGYQVGKPKYPEFLHRDFRASSFFRDSQLLYPLRTAKVDLFNLSSGMHAPVFLLSPTQPMAFSLVWCRD